MGMYLLGIITCIVLKVAGDEADRQDAKKAAMLARAKQPLNWQ